jgi:serine/threonine protein phosphatase PrpC
VTSLRAAGSTDPGQVRGQNQDTYLARDDLVLVADGMGGYAGGEVAAEIAAEVVGIQFLGESTASGLATAVLEANRRIFERGTEPGLEGMGTTLVAAAVVGGPDGTRVLLANVGDSRAYLLRHGDLRQLTEDHSVAAELVRIGRIDEEEGREHPGRHVLTRALGVDRDVAPDLIELVPEEGDRLLLCSDGLSNELGPDEIRALLEVGEPSDAARALVAAANAHGGLDNITAVVADVAPDDVVIAPLREDVTAPEPAAPAPTGANEAAPAALIGAPTTGIVAVAADPDATGSITKVPPLARPTIRPVLTLRERRRRRREEWRARRAVNTWVSIRGAVFLLAVIAVLVAAFGVLRWYGTSNYVVTVKGRHIEVVQGQLGGFLWWPAKLVVRYPYGVFQLPTVARDAVEVGVNEPSLVDAERYVNTMHVEWRVSRGLPTGTSTTTTTTYASASASRVP